ncbi:ATP-binding protein [Halobellus rarus]|uniref:ATP-binding protein n=1 Tax=Halobellus rarus TaxID=1126237 RepID=A0ABD6CQJ3_9EURY
MSTIESQYRDDSSSDAKDSVLDEFREPIRNTQQATRDSRRHTDARSMREAFGIPRWDRDRFEYASVMPDCFEHSWDAPPNESNGGTDFLARGKPGKGKSTLANYLAVRQLELNDEKVVWRGSASRSEWLPLSPWTRLCLPEGVDVTARLEGKDPTQPPVELDVDELEEIVREVVRYRDPVHLNQELLKPGMFHVVYPDPRMRGCQAVYEDSPERTVETPASRDELFAAGDPAGHWWFAWALSRVEHGPHHWTTWICDEIGDLCPQSAKKDAFGSYQKVELLKDTWVDLRKFGVSVFAFAHSEKDVHQMIRHKLRWRIQMPGTANPTKAGDIVGFESIPMHSDMTSRMPVGQALMYTETRFEKFGWKDMPSASDYKLKIRLEEGR